MEGVIVPFAPVLERMCGRLVLVEIEKNLIGVIFEGARYCSECNDNKQAR